MVRVPCCEKMGMKKGPWTPEEDQILISYIQRCGHGNWRALPKLAGLPRCGKSCRLRWVNYLRPDIKRGNFTTEEEEIIFKLHQSLGNRWSAIAASLQGRTDNEIKNYWHTHLKKKLKKASGSTTEIKEIAKARIGLQHRKPSTSSPNSMESSSCAAAATTTDQPRQPKEFALTKQHHRQGVDHQFKLSYVSMAETMKNNGFDDIIDANNRDFWYKLFLENSNEVNGNISASFSSNN